MVVDDSAVKFSGEWIRSSSLRPFVGSSYYHDGNAGKGMRSAEFPFQVERNGLHEVRVSFLPAGNRAGEVKYVVNSVKGKEIVKLDQRMKSNGDNLWHSLGMSLVPTKIFDPSVERRYRRICYCRFCTNYSPCFGTIVFVRKSELFTFLR